MTHYAAKQAKKYEFHAPIQAKAAVPGKHTLVEQLYMGMVQQRGDGGQGESAVHEAAARGVATSSSSLPYGDMIQRAFGRHDISAVQAHAGADAAASAQAMGAQAYATGNHVVLGSGTDLHTVAHEAAHIVQQRGGVQLKGGVGEVGDAYERHADEVADAVVQGKSAEGLLDRYAGGASGAGAQGVVQGYFLISQSDFTARQVDASPQTTLSAQEPDATGSYLNANRTTTIVAQTIAAVGALRVSNDGKLAIENGGDRQAKTFFIDPALIANANAQLTAVGSTYQLLPTGNTLTVPDDQNQLHTLTQVVAQNVKNNSSGNDASGPVNCDEMAGQVAGWGADYNKVAHLQNVTPPNWGNEEGHRVAAYIVEYAKSSTWLDKILRRTRKRRAARASDYPLGNGKSQTEILLELNPKRNEIAKAYSTMSAEAKAEVAEDLGINGSAAPEVGEAFVIFSTGAKDENDEVTDYASGNKVNAKWGQHWGGVVAKSGGDYVTLENYDRKTEDGGRAPSGREVRAFFQMYGSDAGKTWHDIQKATGEFPNAVSLVYGKR